MNKTLPKSRGIVEKTSNVAANTACRHFTAYYKEFGLDSFKVVHAYFSASITKDARRQKVSILWSILVFHIIFIYFFFQCVFICCRRYHAYVTRVEVLDHNCIPVCIAYFLVAKERTLLIT